MPIYDYECLTCSRLIVDEASIHAPPLMRAADCQGECQLRRKLSSFTGFVAKGSGGQKTAAKVENEPAPSRPAYLTENPAHVCSKYCSHGT